MQNRLACEKKESGKGFIAETRCFLMYAMTMGFVLFCFIIIFRLLRKLCFASSLLMRIPMPFPRPMAPLIRH